MSENQSQTSLELLLNTSRELTTALDISTVLKRVLFLSVKNVGAERGMLIVLDEHLHPVQAAIIFKGQLMRYTLSELYAILDQGMAGWVLRERKAVLIPNTSRDTRWLRRPDDEQDRSGAKCAICVPLIAREAVVGILTLVHPKPGTFTESHLMLLQAIADQAGIAVHNARLHDSLQAATQRYRELFEDSIAPIFITDWSGKILEANRQALTASGYEKDALVNRSIFELHNAPEELLGEQNSQLKIQALVSYESDLRTGDGRQLPVMVTVRKVKTETDDQLQWFFRDISERKELDSLRNDLAAMIYHDLRSPLSNVVSSLDMLRAMLPPETLETIQPVYSIAERSISRMQRLISSLLDINRLESNQDLANQSEVDVQQLVRDAVDAVKPTLEGKEQQITLNIAANLPRIWADEDMIRRVLINLLENAAKYTPAKGKIRVEASKEAETVRFSVIDSGIGILPEWREVIFEKYTRFQAERFPRGLGLGLAFCRLAVKAHGGCIWVEGEPNQGSQFYFTVPAVKS